MKTFPNHVYNRIWSFWLTFTILEWMKTNFKISQFSRFPLRSLYMILVTYLKMSKNSLFCSIHQETQGNHVYNLIRSFWLTVTVLQWRKRNFEISQFSRFLLGRYAIFNQNLKMTKTSLFIKKTPVDHVYNRIWSFWLTFTALQSMKTNFKVSQFSRFLLRSGYEIFVK